MSSECSRDYLVSLTHELSAWPRESERLEYKAVAIVPAHPGAAPQGDALSALLGIGPKEGAGMSQELDGYLIRRGGGGHESRANACVSRHSASRAVLDGNLIGGLGRLPGLCLTTAEAAP